MWLWIKERGVWKIITHTIAIVWKITTTYDCDCMKNYNYIQLRLYEKLQLHTIAIIWKITTTYNCNCRYDKLQLGTYNCDCMKNYNYIHMYLRRDKNGQFVSCVTYNASALRIFNSSNSLVRFEDKMFFLYFDKKLPSLLQRRRYTYVVVNSEIAGSDPGSSWIRWKKANWKIFPKECILDV
jgi:hypothetical protein